MGSSRSTSTQRTDPHSSVSGVINTGGQIMNDYLSNPNSTAVYDGPRVADLSADTEDGLRMMRESTGANGAMDYYRGILGSEMGTANPHVQSMIDQAQRASQAATNASASRSGMVGGSNHQFNSARGAADATAGYLFQDYENSMGRRERAAGGLMSADQTRIGNMTGAGQVRDAHSQNLVNADRQEFEERRTAPLRAWSEVAPLASDIGSRFGTSTTTQRNSQSTGSQILGAGMAGLGLLSGNPAALGSMFSSASGMFGGGQPASLAFANQNYALGPNGLQRR